MSSRLRFQATVQHVSEKGYGTIRDESGRLFFVRGVWPGELGLFEAEEDRDGHAVLVELVSASPDRVDVPCGHWGLGAKACFGCPWIFVGYEAQLERKQHRVRYALDRLGMKSVPVLPIWEAPSPFGYRSRAQFKSDGRELGYAADFGEAIAPVEDCLVLSDRMRGFLKVLRGRLPHEGWTPGDGHRWNFIDMDEESDISDFVLNRRRPFKQVHKAQNERMKDWVRTRVPEGLVLELFAGSGNFTEVMADGSRDLFTLEAADEAVVGLRGRGLPRVRAERADLYKGFMLHQLKGHAARTLFVNPPRAGLQGLARLPKFMPRLDTVLYVSCDVNTFATDLRKMVDQGFRVEEIQPLDQMPHTPHVEVLASLRREL